MDYLIFLVLSLLAALTAGMINAVAGGGTLVSFPVLIFLGFSPVSANIINTIALCPGYCSGMVAQRNGLLCQRNRLLTFVPVGILGGITGGLLLIHSGDAYFRILVPYLILSASLLLVMQKPLKRWLQTRKSSGSEFRPKNVAFLLLFLAAVYGGYFGAGVSVIILAVLGLIFDDSLTSLNALKQALSLSINISAALYFLLSGRADLFIVLVMGAGSLAGGYAGGIIAGKIPSDSLRIVVAVIGIGIAVILFTLG